MKAPDEPSAAQQSAACLTAWAVKELPPAFQVDFESALKAGPERQAEAEDVRAFCRLLERGLQTRLPESALRLPAAVRQQLENAARQEAPRPVSLGMPSLAAAACFAVMLGVFSQSRHSQPADGLLAGKPRQDSPAPSAGKAEILRLFRMGLGHYDLGQFNEAENQFNQVVALDPTNTAARRMLEKADREVNNYLRASRDHTRITMLNDVDSLWVTPVPDQPSAPADTRILNPSGEALNYQIAGRALPETPFLSVSAQPLSTFSIDVDTASYAIARRHLNEGRRPPAESVRLEEMINYFPMDDAPPADRNPFAVHVETASAPWAAEHRLVRVALKGQVPAAEVRRPANLVFLVDTSGSMGQPNKLPLVQQSLRLLLDQLDPLDLVTLVTYAGDSELKLPATPVTERIRIAAAIDSLTSGGSTNGSGGITTAYQQARTHLIAGGVNRVILATDGDFNVGLTSPDELQTLIAREAKSGVYLSVLGYGSDNPKDTTAELLADKGNGNYAYIDSLSEARRALVTQSRGTLITIAKDVKIQVEFNPAQVASYRLLGYENRALANEDFNDDTKDAGEIGAGHSVTALYEIIPAGAAAPITTATTDPLKYQTPPAPASGTLTPQSASGELLTVKLRYQRPEGTEPSRLIEVPVKDPGTAWPQASANFRWTAAVAGYGLLLRNSAHAGDLTWETVRRLASGAKGPDPDGFRGEFLQLLEKAAGLFPMEQQ
jgi:secreted protein with Ig-like and vWFA domain